MRFKGVRNTIAMARKRALVVDDSKSARVILSRMLEKYDIEVDMAESAEQAIEYLQHDRPDAIFMDHLMPGMDGLEAVRTIKGNPQTATIPIMMYTSQEGELYVGQARALGAMGVLPKQVRPVDISKVLYELHMVPDRRDLDEPALAPVELEAGAPLARAAAPSQPAPAADWGRRVEAAVKQQSVDLRRFVVASLDSFAARLVADLRRSAPASTPAAEPPPPPKQPPMWPWAAGIAAACLVAAACALLWASAHGDLQKARIELAALRAANADLMHTREQLAASIKDLSAAAAASAAGAANSGAPPAGAAAGLPRSEPVPYGELPFDRSRLDVLRELLTKLEAQGFRGVVKATSSAGLFCLSGNATDGFAPASANLPANKCDLIGNPFEESLSGQQRQSIAFANLIAGVRQRTSGAITVALENAGASRTAAQYPPRNEALTAGEWNRAAAANNRVEFAAEPNASP
ncbi:MAG: response regulator [Steroidobacteraceae bacterium]